jgi:hypothetical protein
VQDDGLGADLPLHFLQCLRHGRCGDGFHIQDTALFRCVFA